MTAAPLRRMTPEETEHPSRRRGGLGRWVAAVLVVTMFTLSAAIVWLAWLDGAGLGADEPPPLIQAEPGAIKRLPDAPGGQAVANEDSSVVTVFGRDREALRVEQLLPREAPPPLVPPPEPAAPPEQADAPPAATPELADAAPADADPPAPLPSAVDPPEVAALEALEAPEPLQASDPLPAPPPSTRIGPMPASPAAATAVAPPSAETAPATRSPVEVPAAIIAPRRLAALPHAEPDARPEPTPNRPVATPTPARPAAAPDAPPAPATATAALPPRATAPAGRSAPAAGPIFRVQLGAFRSDAAAGQAWRVYQGRHPAVLGDLRASVVLADTSSGTFYRLQAGPLPSRDSAVRACNQIKSAGGDCFIVGPLP